MPTKYQLRASIVRIHFEANSQPTQTQLADPTPHYKSHFLFKLAFSAAAANLDLTQQLYSFGLWNKFQPWVDNLPSSGKVPIAWPSYSSVQLKCTLVLKKQSATTVHSWCLFCSDQWESKQYNPHLPCWPITVLNSKHRPPPLLNHCKLTTSVPSGKGTW